MHAKVNEEVSIELEEAQGTLHRGGSKANTLNMIPPRSIESRSSICRVKVSSCFFVL